MTGVNQAQVGAPQVKAVAVHILDSLLVKRPHIQYYAPDALDKRPVRHRRTIVYLNHRHPLPAFLCIWVAELETSWPVLAAAEAPAYLISSFKPPTASTFFQQWRWNVRCANPLLERISEQRARFSSCSGL
jgi:hypothetical protein